MMLQAAHFDFRSMYEWICRYGEACSEMMKASRLSQAAGNETRAGQLAQDAQQMQLQLHKTALPDERVLAADSFNDID